MPTTVGEVKEEKIKKREMEKERKRRKGQKILRGEGRGKRKCEIKRGTKRGGGHKKGNMKRAVWGTWKQGKKS